MNEIKISKIYKKKKNDRDIFQELMPFKVKEILLVATYYDSYTIVREGQFSDKIFGEYLQLNLYAAPRFTSVTNEEEALKAMGKRHYDLVIIMAGLDKQNPIALSRTIKGKCPDTPILMLVNNNSDLAYFTDNMDNISDSIERIFVWNGSTKVFMAMTKYIEDKMNLQPDIKIGDVRLLLLVEDSVKYYSRYLPLLYSSIMTQTQEVIKEESHNDDMHKILKMRARPKVILVSSFEEATEIIDRYKNNLICVISDVRYYRNGILDDDAGVDLISYVNSKEDRVRIPCLLQSHEASNALRASIVGADFINKNSDTLSLEINAYINEKLGFGNFIFKNQLGKPIDIAHSVEEFEKKLGYIADESLLYHSKRNGISTWLMARGEINLAKRLRRYQIDDFKTVEELREFCLNVFEASRLKKLRGRIINYKQSLVNSNRYISRLGKGSLGGKGRGLAFLSNFVENTHFSRLLPNINIEIPKTSIIGVEEFDNFLEINKLTVSVYLEQEYKEVEKLFLNGKLSDSLSKKLNSYLQIMKKPLAVRSSGLFEDSLTQPFAGVYSTYIITNSHKDIEVRYKQLETAIKLVFASIFTNSARSYFNAVDYKIEEERMAVIVQEVVGKEINGKFYPNISGVAQSYNYYPFSYMKPDDGFAVIALGLGMYVVGGEKTHRFCPKHPKLQLESIQDKIKDSQRYFYALDLEKNHFSLEEEGETAAISKYDISEAEKDGTLNHCASVFDYRNDRLESSLTVKGPRVVDFANILKYDHIPLAKTLDILLDIFNQTMGSPIEIEFSLDMNKGRHGLPTLYLLQIKPLIRREANIDINLDDFKEDDVLLKATKGMGNGKISTIKDVVFVDESKFDRIKTEEIAKEVAQLNEILKEENREYVLIGPGRWGTRDKFTGIPVLWAHISKARIIVEQGLKDFPLDASLGSHFFHNVTSMNVGYFAIPHGSENSFINKNLLSKAKVEREFKYIKHIQFENPLHILMDGKKQVALISVQNKK